MTLCERCVHKNVCETRSNHDEDDERALAECSDFFEIIRCKDCEYFSSVGYNFKKCEEHSDGLGDYTVYVDEDDYCSYGKRKEGAEE